MKLAVALTVLVALGCGSKKSKGKKDAGVPPPTDVQSDSQTELAACDPPPGLECNHVSCGGNSALINAFPVQGLRPNGDCNEDQMQLVPGSMDGVKCKGMTLDIEGDKVIGRNGTSKCEGKDLEGVSFEIRTSKGSQRITISEVTEYTAPNQKKFPAYRMDWKDNSGAKTALCTKEGQKLRDKLGVQSMKWSDDIPDPQHELVIPVVSELYTDTGAPVPMRASWHDQKVEWNQLACVDDALAKRMINGQQSTGDIPRSRAALRMWTADYCGGRPFTMRGKMIDWSGNASLVMEAHWTENGASCLTKPRIVFENGKEVVPTKPTKLLKAFCQASQKDCKKLQTWINEAKRCTKDNNAFGRVEDLKDCGACAPTDPNCLFESRNPKP